MATKKKTDDTIGKIRELIAEHPTWSDAQVHGTLKADGVETTPAVVSDVRSAMGDKHTWED